MSVTPKTRFMINIDGVAIEFISDTFSHLLLYRNNLVWVLEEVGYQKFLVSASRPLIYGIPAKESTDFDLLQAVVATCYLG